MAWFDMRGKSTQILCTIFLGIVLTLIAYDILMRPRILIVFSYNPESRWARDEDTAITAEFNKSNERPNIRKHYLGMDKRWAGRSSTIMKNDVERTISDFKPQIIISMDDEARNYIARDYGGRDDIIVVFGGVDESKDLHPFFDQANVTGILEKLPLTAAQELFSHLSKENLKLFVIGDGSASARAEAKQILNHDWGVHRLLSSVQISDFELWKQTLSYNIDSADIIFITGYRQLKRSKHSDETVPGKEVIEWTNEHTRSLLLSNDMDFIADGGTITLTSSPREQGREAALLALQVIAGRRPKELPILNGKEFFVCISKKRLSDRGISLPQVYESAAEASGTLLP